MHTYTCSQPHITPNKFKYEYYNNVSFPLSEFKQFLRLPTERAGARGVGISSSEIGIALRNVACCDGDSLRVMV